jgi:hypothetical protein
MVLAETERVSDILAVTIGVAETLGHPDDDALLDIDGEPVCVCDIVSLKLSKDVFDGDSEALTESVI